LAASRRLPLALAVSETNAARNALGAATLHIVDSLYDHFISLVKSNSYRVTRN
jgi:hypothetical protein